jgi:hypothetical protein
MVYFLSVLSLQIESVQHMLNYNLLGRLEKFQSAYTGKNLADTEGP